MNKDNAKLYLPLVQALAEGKTIQHKNYLGCWVDGESFGSFDSPEDYRVKPEPVKTRGYRRYICKTLVRGETTYTVATLFEGAWSEPKDVEKQNYFVEWVDKVWQYHEVPLL